MEALWKPVGLVDNERHTFADEPKLPSCRGPWKKGLPHYYSIQRTTRPYLRNRQCLATACILFLECPHNVANLRIKVCHRSSNYYNAVLVANGPCTQIQEIWGSSTRGAPFDPTNRGFPDLAAHEKVNHHCSLRGHEWGHYQTTMAALSNGA